MNVVRHYMHTIRPHYDIVMLQLKVMPVFDEINQVS